MCGVVKPPRVERGLMHCRLPGQDTNNRTAAGTNVAVDVRFGDPEQPRLSGRSGEGFRMPAIAGRASGHWAGVRKPPMHEPAGLRRRSMGISTFARVEMVAQPARCWRWRGLGEWYFAPVEARIGIWPRLISGTFALILMKGVVEGIRRNDGVVA
jgi:hypothetical protein